MFGAEHNTFYLMHYELTLAIEDKSLNKRVAVKKSEIEDGKPLNYFIFPVDWSGLFLDF